MKTVSRLAVIGVVLAVILAPVALFGDQLPQPIEKKIPPGVTTISYGGQSLRFTAPITIVIKLEPVTLTQIKLSVWAYGSGSGAQTAQGPNLDIYWINFSNTIYSGPTPPDSAPWQGLLDTESGYTEK